MSEEFHRWFWVGRVRYSSKAENVNGSALLAACLLRFSLLAARVQHLLPS